MNRLLFSATCVVILIIGALFPVMYADDVQNNTSSEQTVVYTNLSETGNYIDHTLTIMNANQTNSVWINVIGGPFGKFPSGTECQATQCDGNSCCPSVSCPEGTCGSSQCNQGAVPLPENGGFELKPGSSRDVTVKVAPEKITTGAGGVTVWVRTGCRDSGDPDYPLVCDTANCDMHYAKHSRVECGGIGSQSPATKAEITFNGNYGLDNYDVSLVDGWNVPMLLEPVSRNYDKNPSQPYYCTCAGGSTDLIPLVETELPLMAYKNSSGYTVGVWSACKYSAFVDPKSEDPAFCCVGKYKEDPNGCAANVRNWPPEKQTALFFQKYYPKAYSFAYGDNKGGLFTCKSNDNKPINYKLTIYGKEMGLEPTPTPTSAPGPLTADFFADRTSGTPPLLVNFTDVSNGTPVKWNWTFGDGSASSLQNPTHTYPMIGQYTITLAVEDKKGEQSIIRKPADVATHYGRIVGPSGEIQAFSEPSGAEVYIDMVYVGITPTIVDGVPAGEHEVMIHKDGYRDKVLNATVGQSTVTHLPKVVLPIIK